MHTPKARVMIASDTGSALRLIAESEPDVLVTELEAPGLDGLQIISYMTAHFPKVPVVLLTSYPNLVTKRLVQPLGCAHLVIFQKPFDLANLLPVLDQLLIDKPEATIKGISLTGVLQLLHWERKTCSVKVRSEDSQGIIDLRNGEPIHAACDGLAGEEAIFKMLSLPDPNITTYTDLAAMAPNIHQSLTELLLTGHSRYDEVHA